MFPQQQSDDSIQVLIRIKPGCQDEAVVYTANQVKLDKHSFGFDRVFAPTASQEDIFHAVGKKLIGHALQGYNSCVFVYGQTGSGKTYTMMGNSNGLMQRSFGELFSKIDRLNNTECIVTCSYFQLYNEQIIDLLDAKKERRNLNIRQDVRRGMFVQNLTEESILSPQKLVDCLNMGMKNRHIGETMMNRESSRSHSIFTISLSIKQEIDGKKVLKTPKLHFVDLAGSQRQKMTLATGDRLKQAGNINKSLTTLGMVINALATQKNKTHIPYRDSKLTCLLKDSLGGNSKTFIIATVSPSILCFQESLSTLNFANRAKMVKVKALINEESLSTNIQQYKEEIRKLKQQIFRLKKTSYQSTNSSESFVSKINGDLQHKFSQISHKIQDLKANFMQSTQVDNIIDMLGKISKQRIPQQYVNTNQINAENEFKQQGKMEEEMQEQGDELIEYMSSNHQLLKKIHSTLNQYNYLKEQIKHVEFTRRMPLEDIKTPSKFERDQYQELLQKREQYIKELQEKIVHLKESAFKREVENKELRKKVASIEYSKESDDERFLRFSSNLDELQRKCSDLQLKNQILAGKNHSNQKNMHQMETRLKQSKELYLYTEEKYENERCMRSRLQNTVKQVNKKHQILQNQKKQQLETYKNKIEEFQQKIFGFQRRDQELKMQLEIMNETLQFNSKKMKEYSEKCIQQSRSIQQLNQTRLEMNEKVSQLAQQLYKKQIQINNIVSQLNIQNKQLTNNLCIVREELKKSKKDCLKLKEDYDFYQQSSKEIVQSLQIQLINNNEILRQTSFQLQVKNSQHKKIICEYDIKVFELNKALTITKNESQTQRSSKQLLEQHYKREKEQLIFQKEQLLNERNLLLDENKKTNEAFKETQTKNLQLQTHFLSTKNITQQHEQLKRTYKQIIKENYKLKGQYISTSNNNLSQNAKNQELVSKVAFYEEKFRLMSIQYNKLQQTAKKLKQKELNLLKKLQFFEQNQKLKKIHDSQNSEQIKSQALQALQLQNSELKAQLSQLKAAYQLKFNNDKKEDYSKRVSFENYKYELQQKEQKIKKKLESAIKNWDHAKENSCAGMSLEELFECWQKIESESRKKIEDVNRSIRRQLKLRTQNKFIVKENGFLKTKVATLQKQINFSVLGQPRKLVKPNQEFQEE